MSRKDRFEGGVNQNWQHELGICQRILLKRQQMIDLYRIEIQAREEALALSLEQLLHIKRRIYELESHGNGRPTSSRS